MVVVVFFNATLRKRQPVLCTILVSVELNSTEIGTRLVGLSEQFA
jgi:hypothetical protein